jgi:elongation factor Ts
VIYPHRHLHSYVHNGRIGVLLEIGCESDFAPLTDTFQALARDAALHIAGVAPPDIETLLAQPFVKDPSRTVADVLRAASLELGERIALTRFIRWSTDDEDPIPERGPPRTPAVIVSFRRAKS